MYFEGFDLESRILEKVECLERRERGGVVSAFACEWFSLVFRNSPPAASRVLSCLGAGRKDFTRALNSSEWKLSFRTKLRV